MRDDNNDLADTSISLEALAADLTIAVHPIVLQQGIDGSWLELKIELWIELIDTLAEWILISLRSDSPGKCNLCLEKLKVELTDAACRTTFRHGARKPFPALEISLQRAFNQVIEAVGRQKVLCHLLNSLPAYGNLSPLEGARPTPEWEPFFSNHTSSPKAG